VGGLDSFGMVYYARYYEWFDACADFYYSFIMIILTRTYKA
jgi:acyl-CoA thioesterase FadM